MLLPQILQALDDELDRLRTLRAILASLQLSVTPLPKPEAIAPQPSPPPAPVPTVTRLPPKREPTRRMRKFPRGSETPRALAANIPTAPVVVSPAARHAQPQPAPAVIVPPDSFGAMVQAAEREAAR